MTRATTSGFHFHEYVERVRTLHREDAGDWLPHIETITRGTVEDDPARFQRPTERPAGGANVWSLSRLQDLPGGRGEHVPLGAAKSYKGLLTFKPPFDLVLYSDLIWQLRPGAIIEFGSLQGGSGLWFADQCQAAGLDCEVHSFDIWADCVSPRAKHPLLHFHHVDLEKLDTLDRKLLEGLPHPWIVIDDAHANVRQLFVTMDALMRSGDYYINEDNPLHASIARSAEDAALYERLGYLVDSRYTDAFGVNMTAAPNSWLRKG